MGEKISQSILNNLIISHVHVKFPPSFNNAAEVKAMMLHLYFEFDKLRQVLQSSCILETIQKHITFLKLGRCFVLSHFKPGQLDLRRKGVPKWNFPWSEKGHFLPFSRVCGNKGLFINDVITFGGYRDPLPPPCHHVIFWLPPPFCKRKW